MTTISIVPESTLVPTRYRAVSGMRESVGRTPGEALNTITAQLDESENGTFIVVQCMQPDQFFTEAQRLRLTDLMGQWRAARDRGEALPIELQAEIDRLAATEFEAAARRSSALLHDLQP